jgi:hypothetical protein
MHVENLYFLFDIWIIQARIDRIKFNKLNSCGNC